MTDNEQLPLQLHLIEILAAGHYLSVKQLADRTGMHTRRIYRLLEKFPDSDSRSRSRGMPIVCRPTRLFWYTFQHTCIFAPTKFRHWPRCSKA